MASKRIRPSKSKENIDSKRKKGKERERYIASINGVAFWQIKSSSNGGDNSWQWDTLIEASSSGRIANSFIRDGKYVTAPTEILFDYSKRLKFFYHAVISFPLLVVLSKFFLLLQEP